MNVTNRRKSTEADTPQSTQSIQQQQQQPLLAYVGCRQAATTRQQHLQNLQHRQLNVLEDNSSSSNNNNDDDDDQEQVVTSTSSDCLLPLAEAEGEGEEVTLELDNNLVTSPARITSSTNNYEILTYNTDSLSREEMVMPSTSDSCRLENRERTRATTRGQTAALNSISNSRSLLKSNSEMVARDTTATSVVEAGTSGGSSSNLDLSASTSSIGSSPAGGGGANENHKIILKLPKSAAPLESHSVNAFNEDDLRKVEPLKINLHNTHHHHHHTPKITIKPVVKEPPPNKMADVQMSSEDCSSSAEENELLVSKLNASEPHIVPKLTIRAKNEEVSTVVPKLTIKINDSAAAAGSTENIHQPAANTPPLPKLTIKTGQDGHSESIITNISPAFSTNSSSSSSCSSSSTSTNLHATTNSSVASTIIPKLTIKPLQKSQETFSSSSTSSTSVADNEHHHPSIPKLCIKGNMICNEEEATTSKIPKLTIKTGQEHAVIITQHNDSALVMGGIPKLTIKTKSLETQDDSSIHQSLNTDEKIPKITIKTNNLDSPNIVTTKRTLLKSQMEATTTPLSPKQQAVPKLTITRQQKHTIDIEEECLSATTIPKMTIKTQSKSMETVPKLTIKNIGGSQQQQQRPSSIEESGLESDNEADVEAVVKSPTLVQHGKTVPKLTIKNLGSPQQKLKVVQETIQGQSKLITPVMPVIAGEELVHVNLMVSPGDIDEFADLLTVDNGGGESSNSQEFCGFNDNTADSSAKVVVIAASDLTNIHDDSEIRRNSEDMDIDEDLQTVHEPKIFQNDIHFQTETPITDLPELLNGNIHHPKLAQIIDTVDLTSSPSRSCSPAQFDYNEDSNSVAGNVGILPTNLPADLSLSSSNILLERLQRETTVIQNAQQLKHQQQQQQPQLQTQTQMEIDPVPIPPPLQPKPHVVQTVQPQPQQSSSPPSSLKYPQLAERLMANGTSPNSGNNNNNNNTTNCPKTLQSNTPQENIIDSIEILDTPEGSPRHSLDECPENLHKETLSDKTSTTLPQLPNGLHYPPSNKDIVCALNNNNSNLKRHALNVDLTGQISQLNHLEGEEERNMNELIIPPSSKQRRLNNETLTNTKNSHLMVVNKNNDLISQQVLNSLEEIKQTRMSSATSIAGIAAGVASQPKDFNCLKQQQTTSQTQHQRSRKQKHEHLLPVAMEEVVESGTTVSNEVTEAAQASVAPENVNLETATENATPAGKRRGRPRKLIATNSVANSEPTTINTPLTGGTPGQRDDTDSKSRRVQLLRKRLAIDMVDADEPLRVLDELESVVTAGGTSEDIRSDSQERNLRTPSRSSRRSITPTVLQPENKIKQRAPSSLAMDSTNTISSTNKRSLLKSSNNENALNHFLESNSSLSSSAVSNSSVTLTSSSTSVAGSLVQQQTTTHSFNMATQIDLTMSSSSSSSNGSTTNTVTTVEATNYSAKQADVMIINAIAPVLNLNIGASTSVIGSISGGGGGSSNNSMLPPTTILSSSDPLPDVVFKHNDFSSILATQQLRAPIMSAADNSLNDSLDDDMADDVSGPDNSGDDSASSSSMSTTPGRGRGRGRGSRGGRGRAYKAHRLGRNASAASKAIAMSRPRAVGALKHTPDPERMKPLYSPSPSVFEEDTRMSADLSQTTITQSACEPVPQTPTKQPDFLNNEESQSSILSNASILDPNNVVAIQNGSTAKKPAKRKKMEVCVAEDAELGVSAIAEYDWPRPKGCCPSKNRDTFMIQEQVALYLGIKSFKRKYPDLPRRQIDMEERNYLQEKNLVSEKMCDLGITAVWASDILDIMYSDFYDKYEEYKDFVRQKHLREIEAKQKSLGLHVAGRGLQARDRAMLSTSKWNAYFNKTRKEERLTCLDLQTLTVNKPCPATAPIATISYRPIADAVARAAKIEKIPQPPTLMPKRIWEPIRPRDAYYPLSLVPGQFCERYYEYSTQELRQFPLNTMLDDASRTLPIREDTTDTDSAAETIEAGGNKSAASTAERLSTQRRIRRRRAVKYARKQNNDEFKVPPLPGALTYSSTESSSSSSDDSSSETDSDSSTCCSSSSESSSENENSPANCAVCQQPQNRNLKDIPELFVNCYTCRRRVHPSCIEMPHRMANRVRNYNWQCADCKCCIKCKRKPNQNKMLYCEQCDRGFHIYCLSIKAIPDGRWSCDRCSICMRCGATKPEGFPVLQPNGEKVKVRQRRLKWINEYRIDHITKLREHCSMLCAPCGRPRTNKRVQINTHQNNSNSAHIASPGSSCSGVLSPMPSPNSTATSTTITTTPTPEISPASIGSSSTATANLLTAAATIITTQHNSNINQTTPTQLTTTTTSLLTSTTANATAKTLESKDSISLTTNSLSLNDASTPQNVFTINNSNTTSITSNSSSTITTTNITLPSSSSTVTTSNVNTSLIATATTSTSSTTSSGGAPPVVA